MSNITIFTAPKAFSDPHINIIQRNAIRSWKALSAETEVILIGDDPGIKETAAELGVMHIPDVEKNELGTPLVNSIFKLARDAASHELLIYLNADIILSPDCLSVIDQILQLNMDFLLVGRRWDVDITEELEFKNGWSDDLQKLLATTGKLRTVTAMDYFIFPRHLFKEIPPFAIGRGGWDNWMIFNAENQPWPVIDITPSLSIIHQNHDYGHLPNGTAHYDLEESHHNVVLAGGMRSSYDLLDVSLVYKDGVICRKKLSLPRLFRKLERVVMPVEQTGWRWQLTRGFRRLGRKFS